MRMRTMLVAMLAAAVVAGVWVSSSSGAGKSASTRSAKADNSIFRLGTTNNFDSINPFVAFNQQSYTAFTNIYPTLVQYDTSYRIVPDWATSWTTSKDGLTWTFKVHTNGKWSDGKPLTSADAAWTCNLEVKYAATITGNVAPFLSHVTRCDAPDAGTLVIHYGKPVANVLAQLGQFWVLPQHIWEPQVGAKAKNLKNYDPGAHLPIVGGGSFFIVKYDKKGTTIMQVNPNYYGPKPKLKAVGVTFFQNSDAMIAALKGGEIDGVDEVPQTVVASLKTDPKFKVVVGPGEEIRNLGFNSNPKKPKNRELLDPKVRGAIAHAINRNQIVNVVFRNYAKPAYSLLTSISAPYLNTDLAPESYDPALANAMLDKLGYKRGSGGVRVANGHKMSYAIITPSETPGMNREFAIVKQDLTKIGIAVTQKSLDSTTAFSEITAPKNQYLSYDMMMWDWIGYIDPDYILTVVNCDQYGNRSDTAYCNKAYDKLYAEQGVTIDPAKRKQIIWQMQKILYRDKPYIQLAQLDLIFGYAKGWNGINPPYLNGLSKIPWEQLQKS
jgi:peptide/nickel transport system substrate-binding protein